MLARDMKELEAPLQCTAVALRIAGGQNTVADALSRLGARAHSGGQCPGRELRRKFRRDKGSPLWPYGCGYHGDWRWFECAVHRVPAPAHLRARGPAAPGKAVAVPPR